MTLWGHTLLAPLYAGAILLAVQFAGQRPVLFLRNPMLVSLGRISYGVYLLHGILLAAVFTAFSLPFALDSPASVLPVGLALALSLGTATLSYHYLERSFIDAGARLRYC